MNLVYLIVFDMSYSDSGTRVTRLVDPCATGSRFACVYLYAFLCVCVYMCMRVISLFHHCARSPPSELAVNIHVFRSFSFLFFTFLFIVRRIVDDTVPSAAIGSHRRLHVQEVRGGAV